jgi:hypothetical protein
MHKDFREKKITCTQKWRKSKFLKEKKKTLYLLPDFKQIEIFFHFLHKIFFSSFIGEAKKAQKPRTKNSHLQFDFKIYWQK